MKPIFESYKAKISALETRNANLEERCAALEVRVLELEAQDAARLVPHVDR
jgi:hypothetical protein